MRLSSFILDNVEPILQAWEDFAGSMTTPGGPLNATELRDHADLMLRTIAEDLATEQTAQQQHEKSWGTGPHYDGTAAQSHAMTRLMAGFTIDQVVAEFRALRASVVSHWMSQASGGAKLEVQDMIRFNEAIDQALAESVASYTQAVQDSRNIFLGILGHDLRAPLSAILLGADVLLRTDDLGARSTKIASKIYTSVKRANQIVGDLLDFTRSHLGPGIPVVKASIDLMPICARIIEECRTIYPESTIVFSFAGVAKGRFDEARLGQVFSNLIGNAIQHGVAHAPVTVAMIASDDHVKFSVHNSGLPIAQEVLPQIFNPMGRYSPQSAADHGPLASLGLGLFIAAQIVNGHQGHIDVCSDAETGTTFQVTLPK
ncbi:ATP-binding protein [Pseudomonas sp. TE3610]